MEACGSYEELLVSGMELMQLMWTKEEEETTPETSSPTTRKMKNMRRMGMKGNGGCMVGRLEKSPWEE